MTFDEWIDDDITLCRSLAKIAWNVAIKQEREACAKVCDDLDNDENTDEYRASARWCAEVIRARKES